MLGAMVLRSVEEVVVSFDEIYELYVELNELRDVMFNINSTVTNSEYIPEHTQVSFTRNLESLDLILDDLEAMSSYLNDDQLEDLNVVVNELQELVSSISQGIDESDGDIVDYIEEDDSLFDYEDFPF